MSIRGFYLVCHSNAAKGKFFLAFAFIFLQPAKMESLKAEEKEKVDDMGLEDRKAEAGGCNLEAQKLPSKLRTLNLQLEDEDGGKKQQPIFNHRPPPKVPKGEPSVLEKPGKFNEKTMPPCLLVAKQIRRLMFGFVACYAPAAQSSSMAAISMAMGGWPGGLPPLGWASAPFYSFLVLVFHCWRKKKASN